MAEDAGLVEQPLRVVATSSVGDHLVVAGEVSDPKVREMAWQVTAEGIVFGPKSLQGFVKASVVRWTETDSDVIGAVAAVEAYRASELGREREELLTLRIALGL